MIYILTFYVHGSGYHLTNTSNEKFLATNYSSQIKNGNKILLKTNGNQQYLHVIIKHVYEKKILLPGIIAYKCYSKNKKDIVWACLHERRIFPQIDGAIYAFQTVVFLHEDTL